MTPTTPEFDPATEYLDYGDSPHGPVVRKRGGPWTRHGHEITGFTVAGPGRPPVARCGGVRLCPQCQSDAGQFGRRIFEAIETPDEEPEVTVTMRVPMSERTYRKLKAAASLRGVGQGQLAAQIVEERLGDYMNFGTEEVSWPFGNRPSGESV